ncbi:MAG: hypothetical protein AB8B65_16810 [Kordia sp.]|uniref:hypothetical protein n=1 Tax=Kordia sp. TaxID=1965332 RepID=UPI00385C221C
MKKQKFTSVSLKLKKVNIANLNLFGGKKPPQTDESNCCSKPPVCAHTVSTRPDSIADG